MAPPLLLILDLEETINEENERKEWKHIEGVVGYVKKDEPTRIIAYNARE